MERATCHRIEWRQGVHSLECFCSKTSYAYRLWSMRCEAVMASEHSLALTTDRDIVVRLVAEAPDPATTTLADLCSHAFVTVPHGPRRGRDAAHAHPYHASRARGRRGAAGGHGVARGSRWSGIRTQHWARSAPPPRCLTGGSPTPPPRRQCLRRIQGRSLWRKCGKRPRRKNNKLGRNGPIARRAWGPSRCCSGAFGSCCPPCPPP